MYIPAKHAQGMPASASIAKVKAGIEVDRDVTEFLNDVRHMDNK